MKKTILAAIIPALLMGASSSALAFDLIKTDDISVNMNGDIDLKMYYKEEGGDSSTTWDGIFDDFDFTFKYKINDSLTFQAETDLDFGAGNEGDTDIAVKGAWIGIKTDYGMLRAGSGETSMDPLGIDSSEVTSAGRGSSETDGNATFHDNMIRYDLTVDDLWVSATYGMEMDDDDQQRILQAAFQYTPGDLRVEGGAGYSEKIDEWDATFAQAQVEYTFDGLRAGALVGYQTSTAEGATDDAELWATELDFSYKVTKKMKVMGGWDHLMSSLGDQDEDYDLVYVGMKYTFSKWVSVYAELGYADGEYADENGTIKNSDDEEKLAGILVDVNF